MGRDGEKTNPIKANCLPLAGIGWMARKFVGNGLVIAENCIASRLRFMIIAHYGAFLQRLCGQDAKFCSNSQNKCEFLVCRALLLL